MLSIANIIYFCKYVDDPTVLSDAEFDLELDIMRKNVNEIYNDNDDDKENDVENISPLKKRKVDNSQVKEIKNISPRIADQQQQQKVSHQAKTKREEKRFEGEKGKYSYYLVSLLWRIWIN